MPKSIHSFSFSLQKKGTPTASYTDKPPNATNIIRDKRTRDKRTKGTPLK